MTNAILRGVHAKTKETRERSFQVSSSPKSHEAYDERNDDALHVVTLQELEI